MWSPQQQNVADVATWSAQQVNAWGASLERQLEEIGDVQEELLQDMDGGFLGGLDSKMLQKLGLQLGRLFRMVEAAKAKKNIKPAVGPPTPQKTTQKQTQTQTQTQVQVQVQAQTQGPPDSSSSSSRSSSAQTKAKVEPPEETEEDAINAIYERAKKKVEATKAAAEAAQAPQQELKTEPPKRLLAAELFAGSHSVARHCLQHQQQPSPYSLAAYAAIEMQQPDGKKFRAPEPQALGLTPEHHLSLHARVQDPAARTALIDFVRHELQGSGLDGVVVFGGPPCTKYSNADKQFWIRKERLEQTQVAHADAQTQLQQLLQTQADGGAVPAGQLARARGLVVSTEEAYAAAAAAVANHELDVQAADEIVSSFLTLFQEIQRECKKAGNVPCHLVMENPYSSADRALWNRPFMKESHLLNLPDRPRAQEVAHQEGFQPSSTAWLNTIYQNWCTYGPGYPKKDTIVFTTLSRTALPDRDCANHCKCPIREKTGKHGAQVANMPDRAFESAQWPTEFVGAVLRACVGSEPYVGL